MKPTPLIVLAALLAAAPVLAEEAPPAAAPAPEAAPAPAAPADGAAAAAPAAPAAPAENQGCLECHGDPEMEIVLKSEETLNLGVDAAKLGGSMHAKLACTACHPEFKGTEGGHPKKRYKSTREFAINYSEHCQTCHFANYTRTQDSVHHAEIQKGNLRAAACSDCHGAHDITRAAEPRSKISQTCSKCHSEISVKYAQSVHGKALLEKSNPDVPACTDCHRSHDIADPRAGAWLLKTPEMCGNCHTNEKVMKKYGLSTNVLQTYLSDFHGMTASLQQSKGEKPVVALCTDCHGVHDITKVDDPNSKVIQANLVKTCQSCHPDASDTFPAAWLSHYEPSWDKAPLVYGVKIFYLFVIPFMIGGLVLQVILHLWRVVVNR